MFYYLLFGHFPFNTLFGGIQELNRKIIETPIDFEEPHWSEISESAKDLIMKMLTKDPNLRPTAPECLNHEWFNEVS